MFETICSLIPGDSDYPARSRDLDILRRVVNGTIYDVLPYQFHQERTAGGEYIPLRQRRPNVRYNLCRIVVEDSVSLLFSEGHFPSLDSDNEIVRDALNNLLRQAKINQVMTEAAIRGSVGSVAVLMRVLDDQIRLQVLETTYLTPVWSPRDPDTLLKVVERYKLPGGMLVDNGYALPDSSLVYWFQREWNADCETWYTPTPVGGALPSQVDLERTFRHGLGFVPVVWIRNLPGWPATQDGSDGACTFQAAIESQIEIDYQLSQAARGLKYSSDPTLLIKEPARTDAHNPPGAGHALVVSEKGDAKLLEIGGTASSAVIEYVRTLRELALESVHGNRASADRLTTAQSGRALEMMNQGLLWLADNLRVSYGENGIIALARLILRASQVFDLKCMGQPVPALDETANLSLRWPSWYPPTAEDRQKDAQTIGTLSEKGLMDLRVAATLIGEMFSVENTFAEPSLTPDIPA
jgi:hypothetical protein